MTKKGAVTVIVSVALLGSAAEAAVVELVCQDIRHDPLPADLWSFDYDSQVLTLLRSVHEINTEPYEWFSREYLRVDGFLDSESRFTIIENITNKTGVSLTRYAVIVGGSIISWHTIVLGSVLAHVRHLRS